MDQQLVCFHFWFEKQKKEMRDDQKNKKKEKIDMLYTNYSIRQIE